MPAQEANISNHMLIIQAIVQSIHKSYDYYDYHIIKWSRKFLQVKKLVSSWLISFCWLINSSAEDELNDVNQLILVKEPEFLIVIKL